MTVKELVKNQRVRFTHYFDGDLWYEVIGKDFDFPVPIKDIGIATFNAEDKAILFMRYIRKHMSLLDSGISRSL